MWMGVSSKVTCLPDCFNYTTHACNSCLLPMLEWRNGRNTTTSASSATFLVPLPCRFHRSVCRVLWATVFNLFPWSSRRKYLSSHKHNLLHSDEYHQQIFFLGIVLSQRFAPALQFITGQVDQIMESRWKCVCRDTVSFSNMGLCFMF